MPVVTQLIVSARARIRTQIYYSNMKAPHSISRLERNSVSSKVTSPQSPAKLWQSWDLNPRLLMHLVKTQGLREGTSLSPSHTARESGLDLRPA